MVSTSNPSLPQLPVEEGVDRPVHAALQINAANGTVIRVYRMFMPKGAPKIVAEQLRAGTNGTWDVVAETEMHDNLALAFGRVLGQLGPYIWSLTDQ